MWARTSQEFQKLRPMRTYRASSSSKQIIYGRVGAGQTVRIRNNVLRQWGKTAVSEATPSVGGGSQKFLASTPYMDQCGRGKGGEPVTIPHADGAIRRVQAGTSYGAIQSSMNHREASSFINV